MMVELYYIAILFTYRCSHAIDLDNIETKQSRRLVVALQLADALEKRFRLRPKQRYHVKEVDQTRCHLDLARSGIRHK